MLLHKQQAFWGSKQKQDFWVLEWLNHSPGLDIMQRGNNCKQNVTVWINDMVKDNEPTFYSMVIIVL